MRKPKGYPSALFYSIQTELAAKQNEAIKIWAKVYPEYFTLPQLNIISVRKYTQEL